MFWSFKNYKDNSQEFVLKICSFKFFYLLRDFFQFLSCSIDIDWCPSTQFAFHFLFGEPFRLSLFITLSSVFILIIIWIFLFFSFLINAAYDIGNFYEVSSKFNSLNKDIALVEYYIKTRAAEEDEETKEKKDPDYNEDKYRAECDEKR
jgi:hypothetical protein